MKKLLTCLLLITIFLNKIKAETIQMMSNIEPTYTIMLPTKVDITDENIEFSYYVKADIYANSKLVIKFNEATIKDAKKEFEVEVEQDKYEYTYNELSDSYDEYKVYLSHDKLPAGCYEGDLSVIIKMVDAS